MAADFLILFNTVKHSALRTWSDHLALLHSTRNANLGAQELGRNHTLSQTEESGLRDAVLTSPMELGQEAERALIVCRAQVQS